MQTGIPEYMRPAFAQQGVDPDTLCFAIHTDLTASGEGADVYTALSGERLYILTGLETVVRVSGARRIVAAYAPQRLDSYALEELKEIRCERLLSTGRLCVGEGGDARQILLFSVGFLRDAERFCKAAENIRAGRDALEGLPPEEERFCPRCGTRYPEPERAVCPKCMDKISLTRSLLGVFKHYKGKVAAILITMLAGSAFSVVTPLVGNKLLFDDVLTKGGRWYGAILGIVLLILLVRAVAAALNILYSYVLSKTVPWIVYDLKLRIFEAMQRLSVGFYTSKRTGSLMNRVPQDANNIYWFCVDGFPYIMVQLLPFAGVFTFMCLLSVPLAMICVGILPVGILMFRILWRVFARFHHKSWIYQSQMNSMVGDAVGGQRVIKAFARESDEASRFTEVSDKHAAVNAADLNTGYTAFPLIYLFLFAGQVAVTAVGSGMVLRGTMTIGTLLTFIAYLSMLYGPLEFMSWVSNWWARCADSAQRVFEIIDAEPDIADPKEPAKVGELRGEIDIENVSFEYDPATPVLKNLNLHVEAGRMLGIVGKTGAGKSTLANLIARLYDVTEGCVRIYGVDVRKLPLRDLRRSIGSGSQYIFLFIGPIADNIRYARPDAPMDEVIRAAKAACAHDFIMKLPDAYETKVGAGGQELSGGERQRLSIARAILQDPRILILDEATAAMDTETEANIQKAIGALQNGRTTIAIAHRLSTLRDADTLAVIGDGRVLESGTHRELLARGGEYHKLYSIQLEGLSVVNADA